jgi:hypothetical protein
VIKGANQTQVGEQVAVHVRPRVFGRAHCGHARLAHLRFGLAGSRYFVRGDVSSWYTNKEKIAMRRDKKILPNNE